MMRQSSSFSLIGRHGGICFIERKSSVVLSFFEDRGLIIFILVDMVEHMFFLFRNKHTILLFLVFSLGSTLDSTLSLGLLFYLSIFLFEVIETINEFFSEETFILLKTIFLTTESCSFNILNFEFDSSTWY